jgi:hypothetical protein
MYLKIFFLNGVSRLAYSSGFGGLEVACWPLLPKFAGSNSAEASDFSGEKGKVKPSVPCRALQHVKEPKSDVEVATFDKILGHFSPIVPPSAAGFAGVASDAGGLLWRELERSKSLVLLQVGGLDVPLATALCKTFLLRMLNDS